MKSAEITAFLRPNPQFTLSADGTQIARHNGVWQPLTGTQYQPNVSYLHERQRKRELRLESAKEGTQIAGSQHEDLERNLLFRSEEHTSELQSLRHLVCRLLLE